LRAPAFTAEQTLYRTSRHYHTVGCFGKLETCRATSTSELSPSSQQISLGGIYGDYRTELNSQVSYAATDSTTCSRRWYDWCVTDCHDAWLACVAAGLHGCVVSKGNPAVCVGSQVGCLFIHAWCLSKCERRYEPCDASNCEFCSNGTCRGCTYGRAQCCGRGRPGGAGCCPGATTCFDDATGECR
jgi:hypothetical protein